MQPPHEGFNTLVELTELVSKLNSLSQKKKQELLKTFDVLVNETTKESKTANQQPENKQE